MEKATADTSGMSEPGPPASSSDDVTAEPAEQQAPLQEGGEPSLPPLVTGSPRMGDTGPVVGWTKEPEAVKPRLEPKVRRVSRRLRYGRVCFRASCCLGTIAMTVATAVLSAMPLFYEGPKFMRVDAIPPPSPPAPPSAPGSLFSEDDIAAANVIGKMLGAQTLVLLAAVCVWQLIVQWRVMQRRRLGPGEPSFLKKPLKAKNRKLLGWTKKNKEPGTPKPSTPGAAPTVVSTSGIADALDNLASPSTGDS